MRLAFVGASELSVATAELLVAQSHEVIIIEKDEQTIEQLDQWLDCAFLQGDGSDPETLREVNPQGTDVLFCLTDSDQVNLIASLLGRSLGFSRVITKIINPAFEDICQELGLSDTIIPSRTIGRYLADMLQGQDVLELSPVFKGEARLFSMVAGPEDEGHISELELPRNAQVICFFRDGGFNLVQGDDSLREGDEVVILTHADNLPALRERWQPQPSEDQDQEKE